MPEDDDHPRTVTGMHVTTTPDAPLRLQTHPASSQVHEALWRECREEPMQGCSEADLAFLLLKVAGRKTRNNTDQ